MGCASFNGTNPSKFEDEFSLLYKCYRLPKNYDVDTIAEFLYQYDNKSTTINNLIDILEQHKKLLDADYVDYIKDAQKLVTYEK